MRKILTLLTASLAAGSLHAQITITQNDFGTFFPNSTDTFRQLTVTPTIGTSASWEFSGAMYAATPYTVIHGTGTNNPNALFWYFDSTGFSALKYRTRIECGISASGVETLGEQIQRQAIPLQPFTGIPTDTLIINAQFLNYSAPRKRLPLPVTAGSTWQSSLNYSIAMILKLRYYANGSASPMLRNTYITQTDTVKGWGRIRIRRADGSRSDWMDVLAVATQAITRDSFFLAGNEPPLSVSGALGITQGEPDTSFKMQFYRKGEFEPVFYAEYPDGTYRTPDFAAVHQSRIPGSTGISRLPESAGVNLYPNPATVGSGFSIEMIESAQGTWSYTLHDASGRVAAAAPLQPTAGKAHINTPAAVPGSYFLSIQKDGRQIAVKPLVIKP